MTILLLIGIFLLVMLVKGAAKEAISKFVNKVNKDK